MQLDIYVVPKDPACSAILALIFGGTYVILGFSVASGASYCQWLFGNLPIVPTHPNGTGIHNLTTDVFHQGNQLAWLGSDGWRTAKSHRIPVGSKIKIRFLIGKTHEDAYPILLSFQPSHSPYSPPCWLAAHGPTLLGAEIGR